MSSKADHVFIAYGDQIVGPYPRSVALAMKRALYGYQIAESGTDETPSGELPFDEHCTWHEWGFQRTAADGFGVEVDGIDLPP